MAEERAERPGADRTPSPGRTSADAGAGAEERTKSAIAALQARVAELEDVLLRARADADNTRKRINRESERARADERARVAAMWLPVVDNLERALSHSEADPSTIVAGVRAVRDQALAALDRLGFPRRADVDVPFDPVRHEAVATVPAGDASPGTVVDTIRPGYGTDDRMLRPAAVVVARANGDRDVG